MSKQIWLLTDAFIQRRDLPPGRYNDGDGLCFRVRESGSRYWELRARVNGRACSYGLGPYPVVTLQQARNLARRYRVRLSEGEDPRSNSFACVPTVQELALLVLEDQRPHWKHPKKADSWLRLFKRYVAPYLGTLPVCDAQPRDALRVLAPIWSDKHATAVKVRDCMRSIFNRAIADGHLDINPAGKVISPLLVRKKGDESHFSAAPYERVAQILDTVDRSGAALATKLSLRFQALTGARLGEVRGARWPEMNFEKRVWELPGERMKTGDEHRAPLAPQAMAVLDAARALLVPSTDLVFPSSKEKMLSDGTHSKLLRKLGIPWVPHGFRSSFCDWCGDNGIEHDLAQGCLAHGAGGAKKSPYLRSNILERRRAVVESWANYLDETAPLPEGSDGPDSAS